VTRYGFRSALGAFFHADGDALVEVLPANLHPVETHPGLGVVAVTIFDFDESEVGAYRELVVSVVVGPHAPRGARLPDAAFFPIMLATTTEASRAHAAQRWRLPELDRCLAIELDPVDPNRPGPRQARAHDRGELVLALSVDAQVREPSARRYQCFSAGPDAVHRVEIDIFGPLAEHEDELGELVLGDSELARRLASLIDDPIPFREQCMDSGEQRFAELLDHSYLRRSA
jgi:hypothetical protein